jgi:MFS family permease
MTAAAIPMANVKATRKVWLTAVLALAMFINYVDRGNLATAAPLIKGEFHLTATQMGVLLSAFFWTYAPSQPLIGWIAEHYGVRWPMTFGVAVWALATAATGFTTTFAQLLALRLLLGLGESVVYPCSSKALANSATNTERGRANAAMTVGCSIGPAFGTFVGGMLMAHAGWRIAFILFGFVSLLSVWPWLTLTRPVNIVRSNAPPASCPGIRSILAQRALWGASLGHFAFAYGLYFVLSWMPLYLVKEQGLSMSAMAGLGGVIYVFQALAAALGGFILDRRIAAGVSINLAYKVVLGGGMLCLAACFATSAIAGSAGAMLGIMIAGVLLGLVAPVMFASAQTLAGPDASGKWVGIQNAIGNIAGIVGPVITGITLDRTGHFAAAFIVAGIVVALGAFSWSVIIRRIEPADWVRA